jgi:Tol biopolymer transport system component/DNA-binding winged helix-turn-helix (wHTH) protein
MEGTRKTRIASYTFDDVEVDCAILRLRKGGSPCKITPRAFEVLVYLLEHRGQIVEKQELFDEVWKERFVTGNALTRIIKEIRQVIGDDADAPRYIETVHKRGYRFIAEVKTADETRAPVQQSTLSASHETDSRQPESEPESETVSGREPARPEIPREAKTGFTLSGSKPTAAVLILVMIVAMIVVAALLIRKNLATAGPAEATGVRRTVQFTTWSGLDIYPALSPDGNSIAYSSDHNGGFEIYVKPLTPGAREIQLTSDGEQNFEPTWSRDGKLIAYYSKNRGGIWVVPASGGTAKQLTEFGSYPAWSPDGSTIAFQSYPLTDLGATSVGAVPPSTLWIVQSQGGDPTPITQIASPAGGHGSPSWSPDGKRVIFVAFDGIKAEIWTASSGGTDLKQVIRPKGRWLYDPIYSPDGEHIYYGGVSETGNFVLYKLRVSPVSGEAVGEPIEVANMGLARIKHLTISSDGKNLAYSAPTMKGSISSVPISTDTTEAKGAPAPLTQDTSYRKVTPSFSPDGRKIAYVEFRGGANQDIWVMDADGQNPVQLTTDPAADWAPSWFPDGDRIAFQSDRQAKQMIWAVSIKSGREKLLVDPGQDIAFPTLSPDGKQITFNSTKGGTINIWTTAVEGGEPPAQLTFDNEMMGWPCWSPDGRFLALQVKRGDDTHIAVMPGSGGTPEELTLDHGQSWPHSWSPDGDKIGFAGFRNGHWNVWWVSRTTRKQQQVTNYAKVNSYVRYPAWSPLGNQIVYEYAEATGNIWLMELK